VDNYQKAFGSLNKEQLKAVKRTDGPVLVIAGPGTGKTQLVSTRVGYILKNTDTTADAILLLTFTEAGVQSMRERLNRLIGSPAYDINLNTYHAFGGEIFRRYPDYFEGQSLTLLEELGADSLLRGLVAKLPYSDPLKFADNYIGDLKSFISECKRALLSPDDIGEVSKHNLAFIKTANKACRQHLDKLAAVNKKSVPIFERLHQFFAEQPDTEHPDDVLPLVRYAQGELAAALAYFTDTAKTTLLTEWKRRWLAKDETGRFVIDGAKANQRLSAAAGIYRKYEASLRRQHLYDYDDMILRAIEALETNPELKYSLAENYSYIMLDEFQDTNPAQFKLVKLLTDHPVHEGRPNILAVGDDDQAIYAFQGANHANMAEFYRHYQDVMVVSLKDNYRSHQPLIDTGQNIARQINSRLHTEFKGVTKDLIAKNDDLPEPPAIEVREFKSDAAHYDWIAREIAELMEQGIPAKEIAVLAPKHRYLMPLLPYLAQRNIKIFYERRENILDEPLVHQLEQMSRLVIALNAGDETLANSIWPEVLSYDFWQVATDKIWTISWQSKESREPWTAIILNDEVLSPVAGFFLRLASILETATLEQQLDALTGWPGTEDELRLPIKSPLYDFYFSADDDQSNPAEFIRLISNLNVLRSNLSDWRQSYPERPAGLRAFVEFAAGHRAAGINILNRSPYQESEDAVSLLTAYGAKGREFRAVFIAAANDEVWGSASRNQGYRLSLPANLTFIRYQGASEDERLRLLYVAATRARTRLYMTSYRQDLAGKFQNRLKYLKVTENQTEAEADIIPPPFSKILTDESDSVSLQVITNYWTDRHIPPLSLELKEVLQTRLKNYQLSATDLNHFLNVVDYGPDHFFIKCLLRFPSAPGVNDAFGTAVHNTLRFAGNIYLKNKQLPDFQEIKDIFDAQIGRVELPEELMRNITDRGYAALKAWLSQSGGQLTRSDRFEYDFQGEGSNIGSARLAGKLDRMIVDDKNRRITVLDYKTGRPYSRWQPGIVKLHAFHNQLAFYKLLAESSARFKGYTVDKGIIEFVEPDEEGRINRLELNFSDNDIQRTSGLVMAVWDRIQSLDFPDTSPYPRTLAGMRKFEDDLLNKNAGS
jgi:DNA helicase II / ATP-dependent DNA helicase PcrA